MSEKAADKLIGQSFYSIDNTSIFSVNGKLKTEYDDVLRYVFQDELNAYLQGKYKTTGSGNTKSLN